MSDDLPNQVMDEILDARFDEMTHGTKSTSAAGCKGPLCRKAERDACARRYRARAGKEVKRYRPRQGAYPEEWLQDLIDWHRAERLKIGKFGSLREYYGLNKMLMPNSPDLATVE
jgi:hypothetical protein